ncbi:RrF2 family transcriptional regulator [Arabiibacter massiliensis]|uniref:RrF2 family transcriptional regulator n=1 Tax=Arabiibacter massiliensis TaxID=1870985 RepID=UPI0009BAA287|nr:Rrf2 family transcriptional regulator [Arabiibacter massiliensis]
MLISTKGRYALRLMVRIAQEGAGTVSLREASEAEGISLKYLEQLARPLVQAGLLRSVRGKGGGYALAKDPADVRAGDVLRAVEGTTAPVACLALDGESCPRAAECTTVRFWAGLDGVIEQYVDGVTLADLSAF